MDRYDATIITNELDSNSCTEKASASDGIKVAVHIPENITENLKQQKINTIYDILNS